MKKYETLLDNFDQFNPMLSFFQHGIKPEDVKEGIIEDFEPYFTNHDHLEEYATKYLVGGWLNFSLFKRDTWFLDKFEKCLRLFNDVKSKNKTKCIEAIVDWFPEINQTLSKFWSFQKLEQDKDSLEMEEFVEENFKTIGQATEGLIKTYLRLLLHINRIQRYVTTSFWEIQQLDLGKTVTELINSTNFPELFAPPPWKIPLNQWRNMAYHHNARIEEGNVICWYGKKGNIRTITFPAKELLEVSKSIIYVFNTFRNVELVFIFDNLPDIQEEYSKRNLEPLEIREEAKLIELYMELVSQGFKVIDLVKQADNVRLILQELTDNKIKDRCIRSSMFLYHLWFYLGAKNLTIEYRLKNGKPYCESQTTEYVCEKIASGEKPIEYLAEKAKFKSLSDNISTITG